MAYLRFYNTLDSTNKEARRLLAKGPVLDGLTLLAHEQTEGRGQYGRTWTAEPGRNLTMTIIHQPRHLLIADLPVMNMKVTLGIISALHAIEPSLLFRIKWPNDIYAGDKKCCGILIENSISEGRVQHTLIGIGLNVNETTFPPDLPNPVSLRQLTGKIYDLPTLAESIRKHVMEMLTGPPPDWKTRYDALLYGTGITFRFEADGMPFDGTITGVDMEGRLHVRNEDGEERGYASHEIRIFLFCP